MKYFYAFLLSFPLFCAASQGQKEVKLYQWPNGDRPMWTDDAYKRDAEREKIPLLFSHCPEDDACKKLMSQMKLGWQNCLYSAYIATNKNRTKSSLQWQFFDEVCGCLIAKDFQGQDAQYIDSYLEEIKGARAAFECIKRQDRAKKIGSDGSILAQPLMRLYAEETVLNSYAQQLEQLVSCGVLQRLSSKNIRDGVVAFEARQEASKREDDVDRMLQLEGLINKQAQRIKILEDKILTQGRISEELQNCLYALGGGVMIGIGFILAQYLYMRMLIVLAQSM